jgi:hypothetical protein
MAKHLSIGEPQVPGTQQWSASDTLTWDGSTFRVGERRMDYDDVANCVYPTIGYYPYYYQSSAPNKTEVAFKIVGKLLEKKLIEDVTVGKFIELVNEVAALI